jgi:hypothetical protein
MEILNWPFKVQMEYYQHIDTGLLKQVQTVTDHGTATANRF